MARVDTLTNYLTDVASAIKIKKGDSTPILASNFDTEIINLPSGGGGEEAEKKDVNFYDYDGKRLYSYTKEEFLLLESLPENPSHDGLISMGWNWGLTEAKTQVGYFRGADIGQIYNTSNGRTRLYVTLDRETLSPYIAIIPDTNCYVYWGDGNSSYIAKSTSTVAVNHTYNNIGDYTIEIEGSFTTVASGGSGCRLFYNNGSSREANAKYNNCVNKIELGNNITLLRYAFEGLRNLVSISISTTTKTSPYNTGNVFYSCHSLKCVIIPNNSNWSNLFASTFYDTYSLKIVCLPLSITTLSMSCFYDCMTLRELILPYGLTSIQYNSFQNDHDLNKTNIPSGVSTIQNPVFSYCHGLTVIDMSNYTSVPTLNSTSAFNCSSDYKVIVPDDLYDSWIASNNWSNISSHIVRESDYY